MRKVLLLVLAAVLAMLALPAASADATVAKGTFAHCYTIEKSGRYNDVEAGAVLTKKGSNAQVHGFVAVTKACQKANSTPVVRVTIIYAQLKNTETNKVVRQSGTHSATKKGVARSTTSAKFLHCHTGYEAWIKISYAYQDKSYVRPFWIHGKKFFRC